MSDRASTTDYEPTPEEERALDLSLAAARERARSTPSSRYVDGKEVAWAPLQDGGAQEDFLKCRIFEVLFHGARGGGKTDTLLMSFAQYVGKGYGPAWAGIIFRKTYPELADLVAKSQKWFPLMFEGARFNRAKMLWTFKDGERLLFRPMARVEDYWRYHGHEYPFIGWEELCNWPHDQCFRQMMACCRCATPGVPLMVRATTNPYGPGHNWVKARYRLDGRWWTTCIVDDAVDENGHREPPRAALHGRLEENYLLLHAVPDYKRTLTASASNAAMEAAWLEGDWDIVAGGLFDDVWVPRWNVVPAFEIPSSWRIDRSFDWGSAKPFSVGWWAESDGCDVLIGGKLRPTVRGDLYRVQEWYGWSGRPNEGMRMLAVDIARGIVERELRWGFHRVAPGPADGQIFIVENGVSIAQDMARSVRIEGKAYSGVRWTAADKSDGSVVSGIERMRKMMKQAHPNADGLPRENPGLFVVDVCVNGFLRTVPNIARDERDPDRPAANAEDHVCDEARYRINRVRKYVRYGRTRGIH